METQYSIVSGFDWIANTASRIARSLAKRSQRSPTKEKLDRNLGFPWLSKRVQWAVPSNGLLHNRIWSNDHFLVDVFIFRECSLLVEFHDSSFSPGCECLPAVDTIRPEIPNPIAEGEFGEYVVTRQQVMWQGELLIARRMVVDSSCNWGTQPHAFAKLEDPQLTIVVSAWGRSQSERELLFLSALESIRVCDSADD